MKRNKAKSLKIAGFLLMPAGWVIVLAAIALLAGAHAESAFILAGIAVEILGFVLFARAHLAVRSGNGDT